MYWTGLISMPSACLVDFFVINPLLSFGMRKKSSILGLLYFSSHGLLGLSSGGLSKSQALCRIASGAV